MPQMSPLNWLFLYCYVFMILLLMMMNMYYLFLKSLNKFKKNEMNSSSLKWFW